MLDEPSIIVGRDRAHVRELLSHGIFAEVISASAFFDKVRALAFIYDGELKRDDYAPLIFAGEAIARTKLFPLFYAKNFATLYSSFYHGTISPDQIFERVSERRPPYLPALQVIKNIDDEMKRAHLVNGVSALYAAWIIIERHQVVPPSLKFSRISLRYLIDLTALEIEVIKSLSRLGIRFDISFPLDFEKRSINIAVDHAARQFEKTADLRNIEISFESLSSDNPLKPLVESVLKENREICLLEEHCRLYSAATIEEEAKDIAQKIAYLKIRANTESVALVVRTIDERALIFKRALLAHNIAVKDRKGCALIEKPAGIFLNIIFAARESSLARIDLIALISHPVSAFSLGDDEKRSQVQNWLLQLGVDDRYVPPFSGLCRYRPAISAAQKIWAQDETKIRQLSELSDLLQTINQKIELLKEEASLSEHLDASLALIEDCFLKDAEPLKTALVKIKNSSLHVREKSKISFSEFRALINNELKSLTVAHSDSTEVHAVELLMLPELLGRKFDHVFIADIAFGRMPQNISPDPVLSDEHRINLNKLLEKEVLRIYFDDPFEPMSVPPRQALEPFWFVSAIAAAKISVHFSYAKYDQSGSEQAPSEFFIWLEKNIKILKTKNQSYGFVTEQDRRFHEGQRAQINQECDHDFAQALLQRKRMFGQQISSPFAGQFAVEKINNLFGGRIGDNAYRALTPTMLESMSACRFYGLLNRILKIDSPQAETDELDPRIIGQVAHQTLEKYFSNREGGDFGDSHGVRQKLLSILEGVNKDFIENNYVVNHDVFFCQMEWLASLLLRLINHMSLEYSKNPLALEIPFGLAAGQPSIAIFANNKKYFLGGVVDRIDKCGDEIIIIDYKLSSIANLRLSASEKALMKSNFQVPIYLRLASSMLPAKNISSFSFAYASIRDGKMLQVVAEDRNSELMKKIIDDSQEGSLASAIGDILAPIEKGQLTAQSAEQCGFCDFSHVCRKVEGEHE